MAKKYYGINVSKLLIIQSFTLVMFSGRMNSSACTVGSFNLTSIQTWGTWTAQTAVDGTVSTIFLNLCENVGPSNPGSTVCDSNVSSCLKQGDTFTNIGSHNDTLQLTTNENTGGFRLDYRGSDCNETEKYQTTIDFKCGTTLGSPNFLEKSGCTYFFEWYSTVACSSVNGPAFNEVPCSLYDSKGKKRDLSPLIKLTGGYLVESPDADDLYINVCRDITADATGPTAGCPAGSAGCLVKKGLSLSMGKPHLKLERLSDDELKLHYEGRTILDSCNGFVPTMTIVFMCPRDQGRFAATRGPIQLSSTNCQYQIQWQTEYACEVDMLTTDTCAFNSPTHGIDFDLSPLTKPDGEFYLMTTDSYYYYINICADLIDFKVCEGMAVCQVDRGSAVSGVSAGQNSSHELRYSDGELTLIYKGGAVCSHNKFQRTSVISFQCNQTSDPGQPEFVTETECTYFFQWQTKYACMAEAPSQTTCRLANGKQRYDLSPLTRTSGSNWLVLDGRHSHPEATESEYFINICSEVVQGDTASEGCPQGSSACVVDTVGTTRTGKNLGRYLTSPVWQNDLITMSYTDGDICKGTTKKQTDITFLCSPGDLESAPILVRKSEDECQYDMEWHTAAACPLASKWGTDCRVFDDDAGVSFDLSPLSKPDGHYNISVGEYDYYINVCSDIKLSPCNDASHTLPHAAACQARKDGSGTSYILGQTNTSLGYFDGIIKLTYLNGKPYHSDNGPGKPRMTEIAFLCDPDVGVGTPQFFQENNATYFFRWNTKYACPQQSIECVVTDESNSEQYDLSSLSKALEEENWSFVDERDAANRKKYYINVCRPINPIKICGAFAGVCQTGFTQTDQQITETESIANLGIPVSPPTIESSGHLLLTYENGSECAPNRRITSHIHFACNKGTLASTPRLLEVVDSCTYSFLWETEAACPIGVSTGENCTVRDSNSDYVFNLQRLITDNGYQVFGPNSQVFKINVCKGVPSCPAGSGSCLTSTLSLGNVSATPIFSDEGLLTLEYTGGTFDPETAKNPSTVISFLCRRNASLASPSPVFVRKEGSRYIFNFETPLACLPESVDCLISDRNGNQYDLSPLAKDSGNWEAVDTRPNFHGLSYHINVCRPINKGDPATSSCPGGPIGACQISESNNSAFNMGYVQAMPEAAVDGTLSLRYVNGDICHGKYHRSTRINFECSDTPGSPVFQTESSECEYIFSWETPAACPLERVTGGNCSVQVPEFGFQFNLSSLHNKTHDYTVTSTEHEYTINVCGPLLTKMGECAATDGVGACQKLQDGTFKNAGVFNKNLVYANGVLKLNYTTGSVCHNVYQRSTAINFYCDENVNGNGEPHYIQETSDCTYVFEWATPLACPPFKVVECSYRDGEHQYDLAPLSKMTDNYRVHADGNTVDGDAYYINVCRSLWHRKGAQGEFCPSNAASCLQTVDSKGKKSYISLGEVGQGPTMENGHLVLRYNSGHACPDGTGRKRSTVIQIQCDKNSVGTAPMFDHVDGDCEYHFLWLSNYACDITEHTDKPTGDCTAMNPISGFRFDFNSLKKQDGYIIMGSDSHKYVINVCDPLTTSVCDGSNIGSCQEEIATQGRHFNAGIFNKNLFFDDSILFLRYDFGHACHNKHFNRSSVINFVCPHQQDKVGEPVFIAESDDCTYYFSWHTSLACEKFIQCSVVNGSDTISLAPLINDQGYHLATNLLGDGSLAYINLCRPLNPIPGLTCHPNSAACQVKGGNPVNLGRVSEGPKIGTDGKLSITYTQGDRCPTDATKNISSVIKFFCKQGVTQGTPTLEFIEDCIYQFTWGTNVVCPATAPESDQDCTFFNTALQYRFDFTALSKQDQTVVASSAKSMKLKLCGLSADQSGECKGSAVCLQAGSDKFSLGKLSTQTISQEGEIFKVEYTGGSSCPSSSEKKRQATILLICDRDAKNISPTFFSSDENCHYTFQWRTPAACPADTRPCDLAYEGNIYDLSPLSRITGSFQIQDDSKNDYYMNLCQPAYDTPEGCPKDASVCRERANGQVDVLGMVYTQQMAAKGDVPDIVVTFIEGTNVDDCSDPAQQGSLPASSLITFKCAKKNGRPVFQRTERVDNKCQFQFLWESKVACKEERVSVTLVNKMITDPETNVVMNFTEIIDHGIWQAEGDTRLEATGETVSYLYYIDMNGEGQIDGIPGDLSHVCQDSAVCQTKVEDERFFRDVGTRSSRQFFIEDEVVEMEVTKPKSCGKDNTEDVITTVIFECESAISYTQPVFEYESSNCRYYFSWMMSAVCTEGKIVTPGDGGGSDSVVNLKHNQASIIILILIIIIILCCLAIVFHKKERRSAVYWRIRSCCPGAYSKVPTYSYSQLSNGDPDESNDSRPLFGGQEDEELLRETRRNPFEFHDDSDDDILPHV
ncbi:cation-independent mannose-6-phosphate receptor-like [Lytechinus pictus]|uniref:cation-independent mannose-6-phosphate receptor-like n=1 Tax=Lytechinus pictus TaxID=7653 RepID=UPI0030BA1D00